VGLDPGLWLCHPVIAQALAPFVLAAGALKMGGSAPSSLKVDAHRPQGSAPVVGVLCALVPRPKSALCSLI